MKRMFTVLAMALICIGVIFSQPASEMKADEGAAHLRVAAMRGPTAMGLSKLIYETQDGEAVNGNTYSWTLAGSPTEVTPLIVKGELDIAAIPANLASVLYNNTKGKVEVLAINTLGVLYIVENGSSIKSIEDLRGKTLYASGKGSTPEFGLYYVLRMNGIDPDKDVRIEWKSEHAECVSALLNDSSSVALLPQPFVTTAQMKSPSITVSLDLTEEWSKVTDQSQMITGVTVARKEFVESNKEAVDRFLESYKESTSFVNGNIADGAKMIGEIGIIPEKVAAKAIPECNITCITGPEMKEALSGYLKVLYDALPKSVGGALPDDSFYY